MLSSSQKILATRLAIVISTFTCLVGLAEALLFGYKAGCAADLKGGTWGDAIRALQLENWSVASLFVGWLLGFPAAAMQGTAFRRRIAILVFVSLLPAIWVALIWIEGVGNAACVP